MPKTIVWVDDDNELLETVIEPLQWAGYRIERFRTLQDAYADIDLISRADLLLLDMILPVGDDLPPSQDTTEISFFTGLTLLRDLRNKGVKAPAIVLTLVNPAGRQEKFNALRELNTVCILQKPVLPQDLKREVQRILGD